MADALRRVKREQFLAAYRNVATVSGAAKIAGIHKDTHYQWLKEDPTYVAAFADAQADAADLVEQEVRRRGVVGWDEPTVYQGQFSYETDADGRRRQVTVRKHSDILLIFHAKKLIPEYRERFEHAGPGGGPIPHAHSGALVTVPATADTRTFLAAMRKIQEAAAKAAGDGHGDGQPATTDGGAGRG